MIDGDNAVVDGFTPIEHPAVVRQLVAVTKHARLGTAISARAADGVGREDLQRVTDARPAFADDLAVLCASP